MREYEAAQLEVIVTKTANLILDSPKFKRALRECVLEVMVEIEKKEMKRTALIILDECKTFGVKLYVKDGVLFARPKEKVGNSLYKVIERHKQTLIDYLSPPKGATNGKVPADPKQAGVPSGR